MKRTLSSACNRAVGGRRSRMGAQQQRVDDDVHQLVDIRLELVLLSSGLDGGVIRLEREVGVVPEGAWPPQVDRIILACVARTAEREARGEQGGAH
eukprot:scaffold85102_cov33-Tisochrysis_lutea.AAC.4